MKIDNIKELKNWYLKWEGRNYNLLMFQQIKGLILLKCVYVIYTLCFSIRLKNGNEFNEQHILIHRDDKQL